MKVSMRIESLKSLAFKIQILKVAIDIVDDEARDQIRREMIEEIAYVYGIDHVYAVSRYNDLVVGVDYVEHSRQDS
jgi:GAF domain-containing protein